MTEPNYHIFSSSIFFAEFLFISCCLGIGSVSSCFLYLKIVNGRYKKHFKKKRKKKGGGTFRSHMGALFSAINQRINSNFL